MSKRDKSLDKSTQNDSLDERVRYYRQRASVKARSHYLSAHQYEKFHLWLGIPTVVITTIAGSTIFASLGAEGNSKAVLFAGILTMFAAVLAALQTFLNYSEKTEKHRNSASNFAALKKDLDFFITKTEEIPDEPKSDLMESFGKLVEKWNILERESLNVHDKFYDKANKERRSDKDGI